MAIDRSQVIKKIAAATPTAGGNNLRDGRGRLAVVSMALENRFKGNTFVAKFLVVASSKIPVTQLKTGTSVDIHPNEVGSTVSWVQLIDQHPNAVGNIKALVLALYGETESEPQEFEDCLTQLVTENAANGMVLDYSTYRKITQTNKVEIVVPQWATVPNQSQEEINRIKQWMVALTMGPGTQIVATA